MRHLPGRSLLLATSVLLLAGCVSNNRGKIVGKWVSTPLTIKGEPLPPGALWLIFAADGKVEARAGERTFTGTYALGKGYQVTLKFTEPLAGRRKHQETIVVDGDELQMMDSDGVYARFNRVE